ncbi:MAG: VWA domain-containing protein [Elusimicrobiaceae bacterium]|nr:VWA domain-containing protein [Elusimicrobiaceae bacterium]
MIYFLLINLLGLVGVLVLQTLWRRQTLWLPGLLVLFSAGAITAVAGILFTRFTGGSIEFLHPWAFVLLLLPVAVFWAYSAGRPAFARTINYPLAHLNVEQASLRVLFTRWLPASLYTLALLLMTAALARPVQVDRTVLPPTEGIDIILLLDVSASMQQQDFYPSRFVAAQQTALRFIEKRLNDRIGIVAFAKAALLQAPLTLDHDALQEYIASLYLGIVDSNYTAIGDGLAVAASHLKDSQAKSKVIILLTDGDSNAGAIEPLMAAKAAAAYGIRVYTIGTASAPGQNPYASSTDEVNEGLLMEIAAATGGKFYRAKNEAELAQIYDTINELEKTEFTVSKSINRTDRYRNLLLLALCFILAGLLLEKIFLIKVP